MKRLSISLPAMALALVLFLSGATATDHAAAAAPSANNAHFSIYYYWYTYPGDTFVDYEPINVEDLEYWINYGWLVNTDPRGGTLISKGYQQNSYPHSFPPSVFLYRH